MNDETALAPLDAGREAKQIAAAICLCFFFSGTTGLIYEVLWTRLLGLVFGHTVFAITTVLAAFMAGLGLGSYLFGSMADRHARPLRLYGLLEAGIGVYALLTPSLISTAESIYIPLYRSLELSFFAFSLAQFLLIFVILLAPTTLMGGTLPVLSRFFIHEIATLGGQVGRLYALNTFGAVLGTYLAGFQMIPSFGIRTTLLLAAVTNIGIAALTVVFDRHLSRLGVQATTLQTPRSRGAEEPRSEEGNVPAPLAPGYPLGASAPLQWSVVVWLAVIGLGISGSASMIYEVAWTRALALIIGSSTYAFSTMLVTFLAGLALGSYLFSRLVRRLTVTPFLFGILQLAIGLGALVVTPFFDRLPEVFLWAFRLSQSPAFVKALQFSISALAMFLPTLFMGATFPCVAQIVSRDLDRVGQDVGRVYFINTGGAIAGTVLAGFLLIPTWGVQPTLKLAVSLNLGLALALFLAARETLWRRGMAAVGPILAFVVLFLSPPWDARAMASGVAIYAKHHLRQLGRSDFRTAMASENQLLYYKDGISATVSVHGKSDVRYLRVNGKTDASNTGDMHTQLMLGHLPLLYRPDAKQVLVIGLGSGVTAGAVAAHPVNEVDVIEIEPAVVEAAAYFAKENRNALKNPKIHMTVADGRNFLLASGKQYDLIISEPSNPWMHGTGNLFSLEFYQLVAKRLAPQGIVCQWVQTYSLYPDDLRMVIRTFRTVFPHVTIWSTIPGDLLLIGAKEPVVLDHSQAQRRYESLPSLREDLARLGFPSPLTIVADFLLNEEDTARYSQNALLNTDDLPILEFSAPESLYADTTDLNLRVIRAFKGDGSAPIARTAEDILRSPGFKRDLARALRAKEMLAEAVIQFDEAIRLDARDAASRLDRGRIHAQLGRILRAEADFKAALLIDPNLAEAHEALGQLYLGQRVWELAEFRLQKAVALRPKEPAFRAALAGLYRQRRRFDEALAQYQAAVALAPQDARLWADLGLAFQASARNAESLDAFRRALALEPGNALFLYHVGLVHLAEKRFGEAEAALQAAALKDPARPDPHLQLGKLLVLKGEKAKGLEAYRQALRLDPSNGAAFRAVEELAASLYGESEG